MLAARLMTGVLGGLFLLAVLYWGGLPFFLVFLGISLIGLREFYTLAEQSGYPTLRFFGIVGGGLLMLSVFVNGNSFGSLTDNQATPALVAVLLVAMVVWSVLRGQRDTILSEWGVTFLGVVLIAGAMAHLVLLRDLKPYGYIATLLLFLIIWASDTAAYFAGRRWGKRLLAEKISPKKTWEGLLGGVVGASLIAVLFQLFFPRAKYFLTPLEAVILASLTAVLGTVSDLAESLIKRGAGAKDSSQLLPGHGGVLDRFDAFLLTTPIYYYYWAFFKH